MNAWKTALVCAFAVLASTLTTCTVGGAVAGGVTGHGITRNITGTVGGAVTGVIIGHELSK